MSGEVKDGETDGNKGSKSSKAVKVLHGAWAGGKAGRGSLGVGGSDVNC